MKWAKTKWSESMYEDTDWIWNRIVFYILKFGPYKTYPTAQVVSPKYLQTPFIIWAIESSFGYGRTLISMKISRRQANASVIAKFIIKIEYNRIAFGVTKIASNSNMTFKISPVLPKTEWRIRKSETSSVSLIIPEMKWN